MNISFGSVTSSLWIHKKMSAKRNGSGMLNSEKKIVKWNSNRELHSEIIFENKINIRWSWFDFHKTPHTHTHTCIHDGMMDPHSNLHVSMAVKIFKCVHKGKHTLHGYGFGTKLNPIQVQDNIFILLLLPFSYSAGEFLTSSPFSTGISLYFVYMKKLFVFISTRHFQLQHQTLRWILNERHVVPV